MKNRNRYLGTMIAGSLAALMPLAAGAATITGWNTSNVDVGESPDDFETGASVIYDQPLESDGTVPAGAESSGQIVFTPPESDAPGIKVINESYLDTGAGPSSIMLDGCIMASSTATCTSGFQSGKRIKQQVTGLEPVDLVFDVSDATDDAASVYQVFGRLINVTGQALSGFSIDLGFGVGDDFVSAVAGDGLSFSTLFTAQPNSSRLSSTTQFPFGLFGDAATNPNFLLDGFFDDERTGFNLEQELTTLSSTDYYGAYQALFGEWLSQEDVPQAVFWDFDNNDETDALLVAWLNDDGKWEVRRNPGETCSDVDGSLTCTQGITLDPDTLGYSEYNAFSDVVSALVAGAADCTNLPGDECLVGETYFFEDGIEDLANLNLNYAISLAANVDFDSFMIRTSVTPAVIPLPAGAPLLAGGIGLLALLRRRAAKAKAA